MGFVTSVVEGRRWMVPRELSYRAKLSPRGRDLSRRATGAVADHKFDRDYRLGLSQIRRPARPKGSACRVYGLCLEIERYTEHLYSIRDVKLAQCAAKN